MITMDQYFNNLKDKKVAVIGIGISNTPLLKLLSDYGVDVTAHDKNTRDKFGDKLDDLERAGVKFCLGEDYLEKINAEVVFRTPGLHPDTEALVKVREKGGVVTSEMEAFFEVCPCKIVAVTGSDGKTTTTTIISELFQKAGKTVFVGGNIGRPLLSDVPSMIADDVAVLELSSFQLMTMKKSPDIAVITNLAPNHLDIHKSMEEYVEAKCNIMNFQSENNKVVLNYDNEITNGLASRAPSRVTFFSRCNSIDKGVYLKDEAIWVTNEEGSREVLKIEDILLPGVHNVENYMAVIGAVDGLISDQIIRDFAKAFGGVEHRIELVRVVNGVKYYNDSIASSPSRTIAGLRSFKEKVILIAGGYDKHIPYEPMGVEVLEHVKLLVLTGATAKKIKEAVVNAPGYNGYPEILEFDDFKDAIVGASQRAEEGDVVIMSPASASFDKFKNFMERGNAFKEIVHGF